MTSGYDLRVANKYTSYDISLRHNITLLRGDSGTGKSSFFKMLSRAISNSRSSHIEYWTNIPNIMIMKSGDEFWRERLNKLSNGVVIFADSDCDYINSIEFRDLFHERDWFLVYASRSSWFWAEDYVTLNISPVFVGHSCENIFR